MSNTTNDTQATYGNKPTEREPLLSDEGVVRLQDTKRPRMTPFDVRDWYEAKITSGELRVVKKCKMNDGAGPVCSECGYTQDFEYVGMNFCPGCGAQIVKE